MEEMSKEEKRKALEDFFGLTSQEAESEMEDMGMISYSQRKHKPKEE